MENNFNTDMNGQSRICLPMCQRVVTTDISEDFTLPDYDPEIRRVLYVKESLLPPAKFFSGNKLDINGGVDYTLVYISGEGKLCSAPLSAEYAFSLPVDNAGELDIGEGVSIVVHSVCESSSVRVSSPRRLQIRSHIRSNVNAWGKMPTVPDIQGIEDPTSLQFKNESCVCADILCENSDIVNLHDEYILPDEGSRVALADSTVVIEECRVEGELVRVNGFVILTMLVMNDDEGSSEQVMRRLEFDGESDLDGVDMNSESHCRAVGSITDISLNIADGKVDIEANLILEVCVIQNRNVGYISDVYSSAQEEKSQMGTYELPILLENRCFDLTQSERISADEVNFPSGGEIVDVFASASASDAVFEEGKYIIRGNCKYSIICKADGEYSCCEALVPFKYETEGSADIRSFDITVGTRGCKARNDGEMLTLEAELSIGCTLLGSDNISMVERAEFGDVRQESKGEWAVCYIRDGEALWDIAKRYGVPTDSIQGDPETDRFVMIER